MPSVILKKIVFQLNWLIINVCAPHGGTFPDLLDSNHKYMQILYMQILQISNIPFPLERQKGAVGQTLVTFFFFVWFPRCFLSGHLGIKVCFPEVSESLSPSQRVAPGKTIFSAIKKIAREGGLVEPDASTRDCIASYEQIVQQILPRLVLENSPQKSRCCYEKKKIF